MLDANSIDVITVAQAFHWFDKEKCRKEFIRILRNRGPVFLIWNTRDTDTPLLKAYEEVQWEFGIEYRKVRHKNIGDNEMESFFDSYQKKMFRNSQSLNWEGFLGRAMSASYTPNQGDESFADFKAAMRGVYDEYQDDGKVVMSYTTELYNGTL